MTPVLAQFGSEQAVLEVVVSGLITVSEAWGGLRATLAQAASGDTFLEVGKMVSSLGTVGVLFWILHWIFTKELPRRDRLMDEMREGYMAQIESLQQQRLDDSAAFAAELGRLRTADIQERRAERAQLIEMFRTQVAAMQNLTQHVGNICRAGNAGGQPAAPRSAPPATLSANQES